MKRMLSIGVAVILSAIPPCDASEVEKGRELAKALCATCHMGEGQGEKRGPMGIPSFHAVANRPQQTEDMVVRWLESVPPMMPNHRLTQDEVHALAAFIITLRTVR
jgi:mono/diheme cytochrome c family protein